MSSYSITATDSVTFTVTHARYLASKVATDLKRIQRFYGAPSDTEIANYEGELTEFLKAGYLDTVTYGYRRDGAFIEPSLRYTARDLADGSADDDDPGRVRPGADIAGAYFWSYLTYSRAWDDLTSAQQQAFKAKMLVSRTGAPQPGVNGYYRNDNTYSSGGRALARASVRSY
jgi:hypothetical protein